MALSLNRQRPRSFLTRAQLFRRNVPPAEQAGSGRPAAPDLQRVKVAPWFQTPDTKGLDPIFLSLVNNLLTLASRCRRRRANLGSDRPRGGEERHSAPTRRGGQASAVTPAAGRARVSCHPTPHARGLGAMAREEPRTQAFFPRARARQAFYLTFQTRHVPAPRDAGPHAGSLSRSSLELQPGPWSWPPLSSPTNYCILKNVK